MRREIPPLSALVDVQEDTLKLAGVLAELANLAETVPAVYLAVMIATLPEVEQGAKASALFLVQAGEMSTEFDPDQVAWMRRQVEAAEDILKNREVH